MTAWITTLRGTSDSGIGVLLGALAGLIAEVSEDWTAPIDAMARRSGGRVYRRSKDQMRGDTCVKEERRRRSSISSEPVGLGSSHELSGEIIL